MKLRRGKLAIDSNPPGGATLAAPRCPEAAFLRMSPPRMRTAIHRDSELISPSCSHGPRSTAKSSWTPYMASLKPEREVDLILKIGGGGAALRTSLSDRRSCLRMRPLPQALSGGFSPMPGARGPDFDCLPGLSYGSSFITLVAVETTSDGMRNASKIYEFRTFWL